eukprot:gnl/MRDRNA2_/MRDRNA2_84437_c0_seq2.p1 gnl/MRDRNA2_/MRDRNA2_84437_c0~~gnl/MRDRNA2_/MRDRNA2_84437_c0_seq2.p1  ORF type:complete len:726 (-),score=117.12 gnl/MRDRNA2_/MRDRNA2_84437_c0_seq2:439-2616(-)
MNEAACEEAGATIIPVSDCESDDIFLIIQWMLRILCFGAGYLLLNAWRKEIKGKMGWQDELIKNSKANECWLIQEFFKASCFSLSQILKWMQSSNGPRHVIYKNTEHRAPLAPMDYGMRSDLESLLNHLSSFAQGHTSSPKEPSLSHLKEEIHANLLAQRALRGAIQLKSESVVQQVYGILSRKEIAIGQGTFELMVQATVYSGNAEAAKYFLTRMEVLGHKVSQSLVLLVENVKQAKNEMSWETAETAEKGSVEVGTTRRTTQAAETNELDVESPYEKAKHLIPDPAEVPGTVLGFGAEVLHRSLADSVPSAATPVVPRPWLEPRFKNFYFQGLGIRTLFSNVESGNHHFSGHITVVDFLHPTEDFDGQDWFRAKLLDRQPIGWDIEWRPDYEQGSDNPIALMQFASEDSCVLLRSHRVPGWLPSIVRQILCSTDVPKISYAYDEADCQKMLNSFGFQPQHIVDIRQLSHKRGLVFKGLRGLAEHFQLRMKKDARITCTDWASLDDLTKEQVYYAAEDAYFPFLIYKGLEGDTKSQITDRQYAVNQATQQIADGMRRFNIASQQPRVESLIRSMSHHNQVSMMPVYPDVSMSFLYPYHMQSDMQCISFMGNCTSEAHSTWQNSWYTSDKQDAQKTAALNKSEPTKASTCSNYYIRTVATTAGEERLLERLPRPLPINHGQKSDPWKANSLTQPQPWKTGEAKVGKQADTLQHLTLVSRRKSTYY